MSTSQPTRIGLGHSPIHILYVIDQLCEAGGAERILLKMIQLLPRERFRCSLVTFKIDETINLFKELPCPHLVLPLGRTYDWNALQTARKIRKFIRDEEVKIVHTFHETSDLWAGLVSKLSGRPALVSSRRDMGILRSPKHDFGYRMMNPMVDLVLAVSEEVRRFCIQKDHLSPEKVVTLYNGLELSRISNRNGNRSLRCELGIEASAPIVATVGHIRPVKGIDVLVETAARVAREFPGVAFLVIGRNSDPKYCRELESRIAELGLRENIRFFGESENISSLLQMCDVFFLPSRSEGFSNALIEAMACGLPCIATRVGGNAEAIEEGCSGYLVESEDSQTAAERILALLRNPEKARKMAEAGRDTVERKFTADVMIHRLVGCYDQLLARRQN
jgi:glycosyltransferase involved in cell wall biosynthesis